MKILFFSTYYEEYLELFYQKNPGLEFENYNKQMQTLQKDYFGYWGSYVDSFTKLGYDAQLIIPNCRQLQWTWARENGIKADKKNWKFSIPVEQVKRIRPDIFYTSSMFEYFDWFLDEIRPYSGKIFGWISCVIPAGTKLDRFDLILSSLPLFVKNFRSKGLRSEYLHAAFDKHILNSLNLLQEKDIDFSFIGNLTPAHGKRIDLVKQLIENSPVEVYGTGVKTIPDKRDFITKFFIPNVYQKRFKGNAWGIDMYKILQRSKITFNAHIDVSNGYVGNMRMFEATGVGTLLLTDGKNAPMKLFKDDEVVYYDSADDAIEKYNYYIDHPQEGEVIRKKGQLKTLTEYNSDIVALKLCDYIKAF